MSNVQCSLILASFYSKRGYNWNGCQRGVIKCGFGHWYQVRYIFALMTARRRRVIYWQTLWRVIWGILCHFLPVLYQVFAGSEVEAGCCAHVSPARSTNAQTDLSLEDIVGQSRTLIPFVWRKVCVNFAVCARIVMLENKPIVLSMLLHNWCFNSWKNFVHIQVPPGSEDSVQND